MEPQARLADSTFGNSNRFAHFDKNKDGELSAEERTAARKQLQASGFQGNRFRSQGNGGRPDISRFDTDGDQRLSETERNALRNHIRAHVFLPGHGMGNWGRGIGFGGMPLYGGANGTMQRPSGAMRSRGVRRLW